VPGLQNTGKVLIKPIAVFFRGSLLILNNYCKYLGCYT
jgi:hypothetical protein